MKASILGSPRLRLVPFAEEHLDERYVGWLNDPETMRYSENRHRRHDTATCRAYWQSFEGSPHFFWALLRKNDDLHIGNVTAYLDIPNRIADVGILIGERACWGSGFGTEGWSAVTSFLLRERRLRKIEGGAMAANRAMLRIFERTGMQREGCRPGHFLLEGQPTDMLLYGRLAEGA